MYGKFRLGSALSSMGVYALDEEVVEVIGRIGHIGPIRIESDIKKRGLGIAEGCFADHPSLRANQTTPSSRPWLIPILDSCGL